MVVCVCRLGVLKAVGCIAQGCGAWGRQLRSSHKLVVIY